MRMTGWPPCMAGARRCSAMTPWLLRKGDLAIALENGEAVVVELEEEA